MKPLKLLALFFSIFHHVCGFSREHDPIKLIRWRWKCEDSNCIRVNPADLQQSEQDSPGLFSIDGCKSFCGASGGLWPRPEQVTLGHDLTRIEIDAPSALNIQELPKSGQESQLTDLLQGAFAIFLQNVESGRENATTPREGEERTFDLKVFVSIKQSDVNLDLQTPEDYHLEVNTDEGQGVLKAKIVASTFFGARHALETLSQLISADEGGALYIVSSASVMDRPKFPYRGLLLDTGRNYFSVDSIKRIIRGMSYDKLNVLHWHMNEQQSFPFVSESVPELTQFGAYSSSQLYYKEDVKEIVEYGRQRGVMILPELDAPAHASFGWEWGKKKGKENLVVCQQQDWATQERKLAAEPPAGQLNPLNNNVYEILEKVYGDLLEAFTVSNQTVSMFHMGGDEVNFKCWAEDEAIREWVQGKGYEILPEIDPQGYLELWNLFQERALAKLNKANGRKGFKNNQIVWTSELAKADHVTKYLPTKDYVIQVWCQGGDFWISDLLRLGYRLIFSNSDAWYLDCGFGAWIYSGKGKDNNWCSPFKSWKVFYNNSPRSLIVNLGMDWEHIGHLVWGGEAAMWSEQIDDQGVDSRIWPRLSAMAERVWSDPDEPWQDAERRIIQHRHRLVQRGIRADAIQPEFCRQHEGWCFMPATPDFDFNEAMSPEVFHPPDVIPGNRAGGHPDQTGDGRESLLKEMEEQPAVDKEEEETFEHGKGRERYDNTRNSGAVPVWMLLVVALSLAAVWIKRWVILGWFLHCWKSGRDKVMDHIA